jgi:hypothetical protein
MLTYFTNSNAIGTGIGDNTTEHRHADLHTLKNKNKTKDMRTIYDFYE